MTKRRVIIWGVDDYNVMGLFRQLGGRNLEIDFLVFQGIHNCATQSKYCGKVHVTPTLSDGLDYLLKTYCEEKEKPVILNSNDLIAEFLDHHQEELEKYFIVPKTSKAGSLQCIDDKSEMSKLAERLGFLIPRSKYCTSKTDISDVEYPCLLKPNHQTEGKYNEFKFKVCKNAGQLKRTLRFVRKESSFILQQYIPKEKVALVYGCRLLSGKIILAGVLEKDRFCDNGDGSHGVLMSDYPSYIDPKLIESIITEVDFYGLFSVEYLVYKGKAFFIEVNWRNDGTSHLFYQAGANIPLVWVYDAMGVKTDEVSTHVVDKAYFLDELFDEQNIKKGIISREQWEKENEEATIRKYYDPEDLGPYEAMKKGKRKKLIVDSLVAKNRIYIVWILNKLGLKRK